MRKCFPIATCALNLDWKNDVDGTLVPDIAQWQLVIYSCSKGRIAIRAKRSAMQKEKYSRIWVVVLVSRADSFYNAPQP